MKSQIKNAGKPARRIRTISVYSIALVIILSIMTGPAQSFDAYDSALEIRGAVIAPLISNSSPPSVADSCTPLLKSIQYAPSHSATDRNQRSAGKAAALGFVFGVRFALGPVEKTKSKNRNKARLDIWQPEGSVASDRHALMVSAYRQCQKEQALKALSNFRWKR